MYIEQICVVVKVTEVRDILWNADNYQGSNAG